MVLFEVRTGDITEFATDAIVNSLGLNKGIKNYGSLCRAIVNKANSKEYETKINNAHEVYVLGDIFVTKGYGLPCKNIINLITPYFSSDSDDCKIYKDCLRRILIECVKRGYKSVAIPSFGSGWNGYDGKTITSIITEMCTAFVRFYPIHVIFVSGTSEIKEANTKRLEKAPKRRPEIEKDVAKGSERFEQEKAPKKYDKKYFDFKPTTNRPSILITSKVFEDEKEIKDVRTYVKFYCSERYDDEYEEKIANQKVRAYLKYGDDNPKIEGSKYLSSMSIKSNIESFYKIIFALKMNYDEAQHFLTFFGKSFAEPGVDVDSDLVVDLIKKQTYDLYEINDRFVKESENKKPLFRKY